MQISKIYTALVKDLSDRQIEVIAGRFGLKNGSPETLEAIGGRFGVTRERVRQIEASALSLMASKYETLPVCVSAMDKGKKYLKTMGGVAKQENLVKLLSKDIEGLNESYLSLLLAISDSFNSYGEDTEFWPFYYLDKNGLKDAVKLIASWGSVLNQKKGEVLSGGYETNLKKFLKEKNLSTEYLENCLSISKAIHSNPYGDKGLVAWPEIRPKTIRDRIYLALKKKGEPQHFAEIAGLVNQAKFDKRIALASTVHNELIKDARFVLVGRGIYALSEHGFEPGTAKDVIKTILAKAGPMKSKEIVSAVQEKRFFKYNTILVNLQNKDLFERLGDGTYKVREA